jgi:hypothetical protein
MTAVRSTPAISELRELFRILQDLRVQYETDGTQELVAPSGNRWSLWDIEYLYHKSQELLTARQRQAIVLCLVHNIRERDAAVIMGVSETNPVMMYATLGLSNLLTMIADGKLSRFHEQDPDLYREQRRQDNLIYLAKKIQEQTRVDYNDCWVFPASPGAPPKVRVRSATTSSSFLVVDARAILYEAFRGPIPTHCVIAHVEEPERAFVSSCVNPEHSRLFLTEQRKAQNSFLLHHYRRSTQESAS